ncbi:Holliday junction branch migration DNA helicase RuvB [bacterium]|nr:Holliday junction branch migration DNA helicase RuvB [bacterium]
MLRERIVSPESIDTLEDTYNQTLRPGSLNEYIGQRNIIEKLMISIEAAKKRGEPNEHMLFYGPPGLGKTTLAHIMSHEMESHIFATSGPALMRAGDLVGILTSLSEGDILFIDEIHRLPATVEEFLYPAMEDFKIDFVVEKGTMAKTINIPLKQFTLIGATTRAGSITAPLRNRFGMFHALDFYPPEDIIEILRRSALLLKVFITNDALRLIADRSRGTPRIANRLLRRVRDYVQVRGDGEITDTLAIKSLEIEELDSLGLDNLDRRYLFTIVNQYNGGPAGIEAIAASLNEDSETLEDMVEPYLLKTGFIKRTARGRVLSDIAYRHLQLPFNSKEQYKIF